MARRHCLFLPVALGLIGASLPAGAGERRNILMIAVDDLRPMLGCYGDPHIITPHLDRLAARGVVFTRAYCQAAQCGPSRVSLLTGLRPDTTKVYTLATDFQRALHPQVVTLPEHLKAHGFHTQSFGKIFHDGRDDSASWSVPSMPGRPGEMFESVDEAAVAGLPFAARNQVPTLIPAYSPDIARREHCPPFQAPDVPDDALFEGRMTTAAVAALRQRREQPFFLAVGFRRPHLPWVAPKKYFDLYPSDQIRLAKNPQPAAHAPIAATFHDSRFIRTAWNPTAGRGMEVLRLPDDPVFAQRFFTSTELRSYRGVNYDEYPSEHDERSYRRAYMACVSYVDAQIGRLLDALDAANLTASTLIVLWSDHGWHLGEHGTFGKLTNYELSTRVPLIVAAPGQQPGISPALVELVDIFPTLCDLTGVPIPIHVEGTSLAPLLHATDRPWKSAVFSQYPREEGKVMGRAVRTQDHRYVEWTMIASGLLHAEELYDHRVDPGETNSVHAQPEQAARLQELRAILHAGWKSAVPTERN